MTHEGRSFEFVIVIGIQNRNTVAEHFLKTVQILLWNTSIVWFNFKNGVEDKCDKHDK